MNILLIPDKFKGSLTANEVVDALTKGIKRAKDDTTIYSVIASDGGDGFLQAIKNYVKAEEIIVDTFDPLLRRMQAPYLLDKITNTAYIELAVASGLTLLKPTEQRVMETSTFGTGIQILDAISKNVDSIYIGLGGSSTNDAGLGIAQALGYTFKDRFGNSLEPKGKNLLNIESISKGPDLLNDTLIYAVSDVNNPLFGAQGAAYVYASQKGASVSELETLDMGLRHVDRLARNLFNKDISQIPGVGAAGGTAFGLKAFCNAEILRGIEFMLQMANVDQLLGKVKFDYIITGEGKIDRQTIDGKLIQGVKKLASEYNTPVIAICGKKDIKEEELKLLCLHTIIEIGDASKSSAYRIQHAYQLVEQSIFDHFNQ